MHKTSETVPRLRFPEFQGVDGWEKKKIKEIAVLYKGKGISKADISIDGVLPCIRYGELYTIYKETIDEVKSRTNAHLSDVFLSKRNDVIIPASGETKIDIAKASCVLHDEIALGSDLNVIRSSHNGVFLSYHFNGSLRNSIAKVAQGDTVVHLYPGQLEKIDVLLPHQEEQEKIADCLSSIDELISAEARKLDALRAYKKGLMQQLFPAEGETVPRLRFPEFREADEWSIEYLGGLSTVVRGGSPRPIDGFLTTEPNGLNWLKIGDVEKEAKYVDKTQEKVRSEALSKTREVHPGDLILSNSMSFGRPYLMRIKSCIHDGWIALTEIKEKVSREYLYYFFFASASQSYFLNNAAGSGVLNLNVEIIKALPVVLPSLTEQQRIIDCLSFFDDLIAAQNKEIEALKCHKKGLMQQLFPVMDEMQE